MGSLAERAMPQAWPKESAQSGQHASWIAGRVMVLLSHYFQPDNPVEVQQAALKDWVAALAPYPQHVIERACERYLRNQPRRRPTPGDIRAICEARQETKSDSAAPQGDRSKLTYDELDLLESKVLPTARKWVGIPGLEQFGRDTLAYWGERA